MQIFTKGADGGIGQALGAGFVVGGGWLGWSLWLISAHKTPATIFGWVALCLILLGLTALFWRELIRLVVAVAVAPFMVVGMIILLSAQLIQLILSPICVISLTDPWRPVSKCNHCRLCDKCDAITDSSRLLNGSPWILTRPVERYEFYDQAGLWKSARGCHLCRTLLSSIETFAEQDKLIDSNAGQSIEHRGLSPDEENADPVTDRSDSFANITVKIWIRRHFTGPSVIRIQLYSVSVAKSKPIDVQWTTKENSQDGRHKCYDSVETDSSDISRWANEWIEKCCKDHHLCRNEFVSSSLQSYLPLRLLDVQDANDSTVRLVSAADLMQNGSVEYCALSHCWGGTVNVKLLEGNLESMKRGIENHTLPNNFQHAVTITRQLGVQYVWIDSLCIVQNDSKEWEVESTKMGLVYANARCVISATASKDSSGGCFLPRALSYNDCFLRECGNKLLTVRPLRKMRGLPEVFELLVDQAHLTTRGWTFQERYLAGRSLHFCNGFVLFECNTLMASEGNVREYPIKPNIRLDGKLHSSREVKEVEQSVKQYMPPAPVKMPTFKYRRIARQKWEANRKINPLFTAREKKTVELLGASARLGIRGAFEILWRFEGKSLLEKIEFHNAWFDIVGHYSKRQLTFSTDRAIAIAGMAFFVQENTGVRYAAGLWLEMLLFDLLWVASNDLGPRPVRSVPTWSWTSVDGKISHRLSLDKDFYQNDYAYRNRNFERGAFRSPWEELTPLISDETLLDAEAVNDLVHNATLQLSGHLCKLDADKINVLFDIGDHQSMEEIYCLPVLSFKNIYVQPRTRATQVHGILLQDRPDSAAHSCQTWNSGSRQGKTRSHGRYERVGYFWTADSAVVEEVLSFQDRRPIIQIL